MGFVIRIPLPGNPVSVLKRDQAVIGSHFLSPYVTFSALNLLQFLKWTNGEGYFLIQLQIITLRSHPNCWWGNTLLSKSSLYVLVPSKKIERWMENMYQEHCRHYNLLDGHLAWNTAMPSLYRIDVQSCFTSWNRYSCDCGELLSVKSLSPSCPQQQHIYWSQRYEIIHAKRFNAFILCHCTLGFLWSWYMLPVTGYEPEEQQ